MHKYLAWAILFGLFAAGASWTAYACYHGMGDPATTSCRIQRVCQACPQIVALLVLLCFNLLCDALPETPRWVVFLVVLLPV